MSSSYHSKGAQPNYSAVPDPYSPEPEYYHEPTHGIAQERIDPDASTWPLPAQQDTWHSSAQEEEWPANKHDSGHEQSPPAFKKAKPGFETIFADVSCLAIPLGLLGFAIAVLCKNRREAPVEVIEEWQNAAQILSTLFPVLYAAIVGRLMVQVARWKLEEGSTLHSLEQLMGSRTVGGAFLTPFHLKSFNLLGLGILLLWAFSPLGAQAMLRMLETKFATRTETSSAMYFDTRARSILVDYAAVSPSSAMGGQVAIDLMGTIYSALLLAPMVIKNDTMDIWGNVKIPMLSSFGETEGSHWQEVPDHADMQYSAIVGVPVVDIAKGNTTFEIESSYVEVACEQVKTLKFDDDKEEINSTVLDTFAVQTLEALPNGTFQGYPINRNVSGKSDSAPWSLAVDRLVDTGWGRGQWIEFLVSEDEEYDYENRVGNSPVLFENQTGIETGPTKLFFEAEVRNVVGPRGDYVASYCDLTQNYVESRIACSKDDDSSRQSCRIIAQRPSQKPHSPMSISHLSFPLVLQAVSKNLPLATGTNTGDVSNADLTLQYLADPALRNMVTPGASSPVKLDEIDRKVFSQRLTQVLNSYLHVTQMFGNALGNEDQDGAMLTQNMTATTEVENLVTVYHVPKEWAAMCIISCVVLLAGGVMSVAVTHLAVGPEVLGFASTVVRNSKLMNLPAGAGGMEGTDLTVAMKKTRVRFGVSMGETHDSEPLMGVAEEDRTMKIKDILRLKQ